MELTLFLGYFSMAAIIIVAVLSLILKNREFDKSTRFFRAYFVLAAVVDITLTILTHKSVPNAHIVNYFSLTQFILIAVALILWLNNDATRKLLLTLVVLGSLFFTVFLMLVSRNNYIDPVSSSIEGILLTALSGYLLLYLTRDASQFLFKNYRFWFTVAVFIYFSVTTLVFATSNYLFVNTTLGGTYAWRINIILTIFSVLLFIKGLLCLPVKTK